MGSTELIPRPRYLERIKPYAGTSLIKLITGQRRAGKSSILKLLADQARLNSPDLPVLYIDKELSDWDRVADGKMLETEAKAAAHGGRLSLFVDEAQEIRGFDRALRSLAAQNDYDIYVTGSNANLLSADIATLFAGRAATIRVHPLSYDEFLLFHARQDSDESLALYLRYGGLPFLRKLPLEDESAFEYIRGVYDSVILQDIVQRHALRNPATLGRIAEYVADSIGSPSSARNIANYLKSRGIEASPQAILDYLAYLEEAFAISRVKAEDLKGKRILESGDKYYFEDLGLRSICRGFQGQDIAKIIENAVFLRLELDGWLIRSGRAADREIDFVCERQGSRLYVQASYLLAEPATREREFAALRNTGDAWPRLVVSMDPLQAGENGIRHLSLRSFLLGQYP